MKAAAPAGLMTLVLVASPGAVAQEKPQLPKSQIPDLGRPTRPTDEQPPFNFEEYFVGKWKFEWDVPDGPLGPSATLSGSVVYKHIAGPFFEATTTVTSSAGASGAYTVKETIAYRAEGKTATRWLVDSRGFSYMQMAGVGGDLGGYFNLYFDGQPFTYKGKTLRIKNVLRLTSPLRFRNAVTLSSDGGPYVNYGSSWFEKE